MAAPSRRARVARDGRGAPPLRRGRTRFPTTLRIGLLFAVAGGALVYGAWSEGSAQMCATTSYDSDPPLPSQTTCHVVHEAWRDTALFAGGALAGAGATLATAVAVRAAQGSGSVARVAAR